MVSPYEKCPIYENENYLLRLVEASDAPDLLLVYSDEKAVPYFNSDNCNGDDFHYTTLERMQSAIGFWLWAYQDKGFVRWAVIDKNAGQAIGTIELFNRGEMPRSRILRANREIILTIAACCGWICGAITSAGRALGRSCP